MRSPVTEPAYCRLTVLGPRVTVDVALPADVPVAELVPMVLDLIGEPATGFRPHPWRLSGAAGGPLPPGPSLRELGVLDGEILRIAPDGPPPAPPVFDDPVDALAATAGTGGMGRPRHRSAAVLVVTTLAAALLICAPDGRSGPIAVAAALIAGTAALLAFGLAARAIRRIGPSGPAADPADGTDPGSADPGSADPGSADPGGDDPGSADPGGDDPGSADPARDDPDGDPTRLAALTFALAAVVLAAAGGWTALPETSGAAQLLLAATVAGCTAGAAQVMLRVVAPALVGIVVSAMLVAVSTFAVLRFGAEPTAAAAGIGAVALVAGPLLPRAALRLAGLPRPVVPAGSDDIVDAADDRLSPEEFAERTDLARGYLAGLAGGCGVVAAAAAIAAGTLAGWMGIAFAVVTVLVLGLRARSFADPGPARTVAVSAIAAAVGLAAALTVPVPTATGLVVTTALLVAAAVAGTRLDRSRPTTVSPVTRRVLDLGEGVLVAAATPLAFGVMGLYTLVRGL